MNDSQGSKSQFDQIYARRLRQLSVSTDATERKWRIWRIQAAKGQECCFRTEARYVCQLEKCPYRRECLDLLAEWKR